MNKFLGAMVVLSWLLSTIASFSASNSNILAKDEPPPMDKIWCEAIVGDGKSVSMGKCSRKYRMPLMPERPPIYLPSYRAEDDFDAVFAPEPMPMPEMPDVSQ